MKHTNYRTWRWLVWLLAPAVPLHELVHALVADRAGANVTIDWAAPCVLMNWPDHPNAMGVLAAHVSPFVVGYVFAGVGLVAYVLGALPDVSMGVAMWLGVNWIYFAFPTRQDLSIVPTVAKSIR